MSLTPRTGASDTLAAPTSGLLPSRYNFFVARADGTMGFNARTGTFALLSNDVARKLLSGSPIDDPGDCQGLLESGFLHRGDELERVTDKFLEERKTQNILHLTIAPTIACNYNCKYCYQNNYRKNHVMTADVQRATLKAVEGWVKAGRKDVLCEWYGGEPLLAKDLVLDMSERLRASVESASGTLRDMRIITNGVLLTPEVAGALAAVGVKEAQVSFDALEYDGSTRRGVLDEGGGPSPILRHVVAALPHLKITIRLNVSADNSGDVPRMIEILNEFGLKGLYHLARADDYERESGYVSDGDGKRSQVEKLPSLTVIQDPSHSISRRTYAGLERENFYSRTESLNVMVSHLTPKAHSCSATSGNLFVIDPGGYVSRCWQSAGSPSEAMGNVLEVLDGIEESEVALRWAGYSPFRYKACVTCNVLPLCMGGCSHARVFMDSRTPPCALIKYNINYCVNEIGSRLKVGGTVDAPAPA